MQPCQTSPIRAARLKKGLTQDQLAFQLRVTKSSISAWENDREFPETRRLAAITRALRPHFDVARYLRHVEAASEQARAA